MLSRRRILLGALVSVLLVVPGVDASRRGRHAGPGQPIRVELGNRVADLKLFHELDLDIEAVFDGWARLYVEQGERDKLERLGFDVTPLVDEGPLGLARLAAEGVAPAVGATVPTQYHDYASLTAGLQAIAADHPDLTRLISIGKSVQGRELWMMKVTDAPDQAEDEPGVAYIAAMHGDEVVGKEMLFHLIHHLTDNHGIDPRVTSLVDETEIWILPSMNPDGTELGQRYNAHFVDLNRNFPDQFVDPVNTVDGREPETQAVMLWGFDHYTSLSSNFHGGVVVANYPFDGNPQGSSVYSPSPDDATYVSLSRSYADNNPEMFAQNGGSFDNGITNGADWYAIDGGLQDWSYVWLGSFHVLMELSQSDWPPASTLEGYWNDNLESMLAYMERVHDGIRGVVTDASTGLPVAATVTVVGNPFSAYTDPAVGDYHRVMMPGTYELEVSAVGYATGMVEDVIVTTGPALRYDVALDPLGMSLYPSDACVDDGGGCRAWLTPDDEEDLSITLQNLGLAASSVGADLVPVSWHAGVSRPGAAYPDLQPGESGTSAAPHHGVRVSADTPIGHKAGFALRWSTDQGQGVSDPFFLDVGMAPCVTTLATTVPLSIKDHHTTTGTLDVVDQWEIAEVRVPVDISHAYVGDLRVEVISPSGTPVVLHNRSGGAATALVGTFGQDLTAFEPLDRLRGEAADGSWQIRVRDGVNSDQGSVQSWGVEICGRSFEAEPPQVLLRSARSDSEGAHLDWWPYPGVASYRVYRSGTASDPASFLDVTAEDPDNADTSFLDVTGGSVAFYIVTAVGSQGEGPMGHFGD